jgi:hypothetical protein
MNDGVSRTPSLITSAMPFLGESINKSKYHWGNYVIFPLPGRLPCATGWFSN